MAVTQLKLTIRSLLTNPPGKGTAHVAARYAVRDAYNDFYRKALGDPLRADRFRVTVYPAGDRRYLALVKVPSEKTGADFDVLFFLDYNASGATSAADARLYCNSPSWVFTYGYVAAKSGLLIPGWEKALGAAAEEKPKEKNPGLDYGFDKIVHQGALYLIGRGGVLGVRDAERAANSLPPGTKPPSPSDPKMTAEGKLREYAALEREAVLERREERKSKVRTANEIERAVREGERRAAERAAAGPGPKEGKARPVKRAKSAGVVKSVKAARQAKSAASGTRPAGGRPSPASVGARGRR